MELLDLWRHFVGSFRDLGLGDPVALGLSLELLRRLRALEQRLTKAEEAVQTVTPNSQPAAELVSAV